MPNQANSIAHVLHPGQRYIKETFQSAKGTHKAFESFYLYRAIVTRVIVTIDNRQTGSLFPPGTLEGKIMGEIVTPSTDQHENSSKLLPFNDLHNISIPEVGEEVWVIRESDKKSAIPYWISRVNDSNFVSRVLARESFKDQSPVDRYGFNFVVEDIDEKFTHNDRSYSVPFLPGDVIQQGRSDSYIRHSHNTNNKDEGVLELGIKERRKYGKPVGSSIGLTKTKTLHRTINGAGVIFNLTNSGGEPGVVEQQVLGNTFNNTLSAVTDLIIGMAKNIETLSNEIEDLKNNSNTNVATIKKPNVAANVATTLFGGGSGRAGTSTSSSALGRIVPGVGAIGNIQGASIIGVLGVSFRSGAKIESAWHPAILQIVYAAGAKPGDKISKDRIKKINMELFGNEKAPRTKDGFSFKNLKGRDEDIDRGRSIEASLRESKRIALRFGVEFTLAIDMPNSVPDKANNDTSATVAVMDVKNINTIVEELLSLRETFENHLSQGQFIN